MICMQHGRGWLYAAIVAMLVPATDAWAVQEGRWTLGEPVVSIGAGSLPELEFFRVTGVLVHDRTVYVADSGSAEIRAFDLDNGSLIAVAGGKGEGPGEFDYLSWIGDCGSGELYGYDLALRRTSAFSFDLEHIRTFPLEVDGATNANLVSCASSKGLATIQFRLDDWENPEPRRYRPETTAVVYSLEDGSLLNKTGSYPGPQRQRHGVNDGPVLWGPAPVLAALPDGFVLGTSDRWQLTRHDALGTVVDSLVLDQENAPVLDSHIDAFIDTRVATSRDPAGTRRRLRGDEYPTRFPAYSAVLSSSAGFVWVQQYPDPYAREPQQWKIFAPNGSLAAVAEVPSDVTVLWISEELVAGVWRNQMDIEYVEVRSILHNSAPF